LQYGKNVSDGDVAVGDELSESSGCNVLRWQGEKQGHYLSVGSVFRDRCRVGSMLCWRIDNVMASYHVR